MSDFEIVQGDSLSGRPCDYRIERDGEVVWELTKGHTGACWNVRDPYNDDDPFHVCDLDDLISALQALRASDAHREHVRRWDG